MSSSSEHFHRSTTFISSTPAARRWVKKHVKEHHDKTVKVLEVERKFASDIAYGMDCDGLRVTANEKAVLP
jgi:hypothetical protein